MLSRGYHLFRTGSKVAVSDSRRILGLIGVPTGLFWRAEQPCVNLKSKKNKNKKSEKAGQGKSRGCLTLHTIRLETNNAQKRGNPYKKQTTLVAQDAALLAKFRCRRRGLEGRLLKVWLSNFARKPKNVRVASALQEALIYLMIASVVASHRWRQASSAVNDTPASIHASYSQTQRDLKTSRASGPMVTHTRVQPSRWVVHLAKQKEKYVSRLD